MLPLLQGTLCHVLSSCPTTVGLMRECHNMVLNRLVKFIPKVFTDTLLLEQKIPNSPGQLCPDLCLLRNDTLTMLDVTIPYEGDTDAFFKAKREKFFKYDELVAWACQNYSSVSFHTHCWHLGCLELQQWCDIEISGPTPQIHVYFSLFRYLNCLDAIKGSLSIWQTFCWTWPIFVLTYLLDHCT